MQAQNRLPYFNSLLKELDRGSQFHEKTFGHHVHWGYWPDPSKAKKGSVEDFSRAADRLSELLINMTQIKNGMKVLNAGCGFGGTISLLNDRFKNMELVGLNIDERQLERAKKKVKAKNGNKITFVHGDACAMPFKDNAFDAVLAVECIFHFPSREDFFRETKRVLKKGKKLALSDFIPFAQTPFFLAWFENLVKSFVALSYGKSSRMTLNEYEKTALHAGICLIEKKDITRETLPTYSVVLDMLSKSKNSPFGAKLATRIFEYSCRLGQTRYMALAFG